MPWFEPLNALRYARLSAAEVLLLVCSCCWRLSLTTRLPGACSAKPIWGYTPLLLAQVIKQHKLGLQSVWDVPWAGSNNSPSSNGSNGSSSKATSSDLQPISSIPPGSINRTNGNGNGTGGRAQQQQQRQQPLQVDCSKQQAAEFTTWKFRSSGVAKRTIDYIWFSKQQLTPVSRWRMLTEAEIGPHGLPNLNYPSDHMCVTCQFGWTD